MRFLGIYDTVPGTGNPATPDLRRDGFHGNMNFNVSTAMAKRILHLTANNEIRENFRLMRAHPGGEEIALPGSHGDVGGSTWDHDTSREYDVSIAATVERLQAEGKLPEDFEPRPKPSIPTGPGPQELYVGNDGVTWMETVPTRSGLYKVALQIMHRKALQSNVPLIGLSGQYNPPSEVSSIIDTAMSMENGRATDAQMSVAGPFITPSSWTLTDPAPR